MDFETGVNDGDMVVSKNIFLADDDSDDQDIFSWALKDVCQGCQLFIAHNGEQLIENIQGEDFTSPDIIFLDLNMPGIGGLETLKKLRNNLRAASLPVVIYSTSSDITYVKLARSFGANLYFVKPNDFTKLKDTLAKILSIVWPRNKNATMSEFLIS